TAYLHLRPDLRDLSLSDDEKRRTLDAHIFSAIHALFLPHPIGVENGKILVRSEDHVERMLGTKLVVLHNAIWRNANQNRVQLGEVCLERSEIESLRGAAGRVIFW